MDNRNAHASIDEATNGQVRSFPFVCETQQESFEELCCLAAYKAIRGDDKGSEVPALFKTGGQVLLLLLLLALLLGQDKSVSVTRTSTDCEGPPGPEATDE
jgi:hypothetical protein